MKTYKSVGAFLRAMGRPGKTAKVVYFKVKKRKIKVKKLEL